MLYYLLFLLVMSIVSFILMGVDKKRSMQGAWRISEKALFLCAFFGGGIGGVLGMRIFHHKTKHWYFAVFFPLFALLQIGLGIYFYNFFL